MGFDMQYSYRDRKASDHFCGSACCIGGWVQYLNKNTRDLELQDAVATICPPDMSKDEIYRLCYPDTAYDDGYDATPQQAARAARSERSSSPPNRDWKAEHGDNRFPAPGSYHTSFPHMVFAQRETLFFTWEPRKRKTLQACAS
jgi:hypothetical protein